MRATDLTAAMVVPQLATFAVVASGLSKRWQVALRISLALLNGYLLTMHGLAADVGSPASLPAAHHALMAAARCMHSEHGVV